MRQLLQPNGVPKHIGTTNFRLHLLCPLRLSSPPPNKYRLQPALHASQPARP